mmetsp:Transcript_3184/g.6775  ORF Transcript_3184/g.6775 Transcript_3184/m.6775 type:complete len:206 (+) Transcript_3184:1-618(+)
MWGRRKMWAKPLKGLVLWKTTTRITTAMPVVVLWVRQQARNTLKTQKRTRKLSLSTLRHTARRITLTRGRSREKRRRRQHRRTTTRGRRRRRTALKTRKAPCKMTTTLKRMAIWKMTLATATQQATNSPLQTTRTRRRRRFSRKPSRSGGGSWTTLRRRRAATTRAAATSKRGRKRVVVVARAWIRVTTSPTTKTKTSTKRTGSW